MPLCSFPVFQAKSTSSSDISVFTSFSVHSREIFSAFKNPVINCPQIHGGYGISRCIRRWQSGEKICQPSIFWPVNIWMINSPINPEKKWAWASNNSGDARRSSRNLGWEDYWYCTAQAWTSIQGMEWVEEKTNPTWDHRQGRSETGYAHVAPPVMPGEKEAQHYLESSTIRLGHRTISRWPPIQHPAVLWAWSCLR